MTISCIASIDQGTSSTRVLIVNSNGEVVGQYQTENTQYFPLAGQVEHDPLLIWNSVKICLSEAISSLPPNHKVISIGITNQRETTVVWNKATGLPYHNAIVWNDNRTGDICDKLILNFGKDRFRAKTGLPVASYFSATKLMHLLDKVPGLREDAANGEALFGTIDTWLIWKLTGGKVHATDVTNASRTMLMNLTSLNWDDDILTQLSIPSAMLPSIRASNFNFGKVDTSYHSSQQSDKSVERYEQIQHYCAFEGVSINGVLGDQQAALFGQTCFHRGEAKCTYGTGAFLLMNTGSKIVHSSRGLLTTVAYKLAADKEAVFALEGSVAYCGSLIQWLRDNLGVLTSVRESEEVARSVADNGGVYFVPAFSGLYAPYWRQDARGIIAGLTAFNTRAHIVRAALEAAAFQTTEVVHAMQLDAEPHDLPRITAMRVDGGGTSNKTLMQFQSDLLDSALLAPRNAETTAMGAAYMAGLGVGLWKDLRELKGLWHEGGSWRPAMEQSHRAKLMHHWKKALARSMGWVDHVQFDTVEGGGASQKTSPADRAFQKVQDSFVAKLHQQHAAASSSSSSGAVKPMIEDQRLPSATHTGNAASVTAAKEASEVATDALRRGQQQAGRSSSSGGRSGLLLIGVAGAGVILGAFLTNYYHHRNRK